MTMGKVEERLWSIIRNFANLGRDHPAMLVNAVRIIELQELVDRSLESSAGGPLHLVQGKVSIGSAEGHASKHCEGVAFPIPTEGSLSVSQHRTHQV